ncbi:membrane-spanning 4-domains subfamily A member 4A-like [Tachysurus fulvidraco]|uniref:membrane-spanning 4-domains subfamily A member 4A-like n=1 Tax=Tachysurus fulvidraco TaxID=1234273 RepID=UPI000F4F8D41|nr:membrane-spanning 4-domains subfamily A member 4A-like [Tachysurus fulvidraco]
MTPVTAPADSRLFRYSAFLKGEPKALGTVQIIIGSLTFLLGIVLISFTVTSMVVSGITLCGSLVFVSCGALSVATAKKHNPCMVKASLGMNVFSAVVAGILIIVLLLFMLFFFDSCAYVYSSHIYSTYGCQRRLQSMWYGIYGALMFFDVLELIISICTSAFACEATCCSTTTPIHSQQVTIELTTEVITEVMYTQQQPINQQLIQSPAYNQVPQQSPVITYNV